MSATTVVKLFVLTVTKISLHGSGQRIVYVCEDEGTHPRLKVMATNMYNLFDRTTETVRRVLMRGTDLTLTACPT